MAKNSKPSLVSVFTCGVEPQKLKATLRVEGEEQVKIPLGNFMTYRIKMNYMDSESITWITHDGEIVKEVSPLGLVSYKENALFVTRGTLLR